MTGRRSNTRERILDAAMDLFADEGFGGASIAEIERRAGLAPGTGGLYRHFASKEELLHAAVEREFHRAMDRIASDRSAAASADSSEQLTLGYEQVLRGIRQFDRLFALMLRDGAKFPDVRRAISHVLVVADREATWSEDPILVVAVAALGGYHLLGLLQGRSFQDVAESDFIDILVQLTSGAETDASGKVSTARPTGNAANTS